MATKRELKNLLNHYKSRIERDEWRVQRVRELEAEVGALERILVRALGAQAGVTYER